MNRPGRPLSEPPAGGGDTGWSVMLLAVLLLMTLPALWLDRGRPSAGLTEEARAVAMTAEARDRLNRMTSDDFNLTWLMPHLGGVAMPTEPPGTMWLHLLAARTLPADAAAEALTARVRLVSAVATLLVLAGVFWAGHSIGGWRTAVLAGLIAASSPALILYGRLATPQMAHVACWTLSIAAGLWAVRPLRPPPSIARQLIGWVICGLTMSLGVLCGGVVVFVLASLPLLLMILLCPDRIGHLMGLLAAMLIASLGVMPWGVVLAQQDPAHLMGWLQHGAWSASPIDASPAQIVGRRALGALLLLMPWTLWLVGAMVQPFSTSSAGRRLRLFLGWVWFAGVAAVLLLRPVGDTGLNLLPLIPSAAVLLGQLFHQYHDLASAAHYARFWRLLRWPHLLGLVLLTFAAAAWLGFEAWLIQDGWLGRAVIAQSSPVVAVIFGGTLLLLLGLSLRWILTEYPGRVAAIWAAWGLVLTTALTAPLARGPAAQNPIVIEARDLAAELAERPVYFLDDGQATVDPRVQLYNRAVIRGVRPVSVAALAAQHPAMVLLTSWPPDEAGAVRSLTSDPGESWRVMSRWPMVGLWAVELIKAPAEPAAVDDPQRGLDAVEAPSVSPPVVDAPPADAPDLIGDRGAPGGGAVLERLPPDEPAPEPAASPDAPPDMPAAAGSHEDTPDDADDAQ